MSIKQAQLCKQTQSHSDRFIETFSSAIYISIRDTFLRLTFTSLHLSVCHLVATQVSLFRCKSY